MANRATGQAVNIKRYNTGKDLEINNSGAALITGDIIISGGTAGNNLINTQNIVVTDTPQQISSGLSNRSQMMLTNLATGDFYIGGSDVTVDNGYPLFAQYAELFSFGSNIEPYVVCGFASGDLRVMEVGP